jgi:hypothetical protein
MWGRLPRLRRAGSLSLSRCERDALPAQSLRIIAHRAYGATAWTLAPSRIAAAHRSNANGGIAIVETDSVEAILEGIAPWTPFFTFEIAPIVATEDAMPLFAKTNTWRDSVS